MYFSQEQGSDKVKVLVLFEPAEDGVKTTAASVGLYDAAGKLIVQGTADAASLARSPSMLAVLANPGRYRLRLAAVNDRGRAGTLDQDIDVGLVSAGPLKLATLVPGVAGRRILGPAAVCRRATPPWRIVAVYGALGDDAAHRTTGRSPTRPARRLARCRRRSSTPPTARA